MKEMLDRARLREVRCVLVTGPLGYDLSTLARGVAVEWESQRSTESTPCAEEPVLVLERADWFLGRTDRGELFELLRGSTGKLLVICSDGDVAMWRSVFLNGIADDVWVLEVEVERKESLLTRFPEARPLLENALTEEMLSNPYAAALVCEAVLAGWDMPSNAGDLRRCLVRFAESDLVRLQRLAHPLLERWMLMGWFDDRFEEGGKNVALLAEGFRPTYGVRRTFREWVRERTLGSVDDAAHLLENALLGERIPRSFRNDVVLAVLRSPAANVVFQRMNLQLWAHNRALINEISLYLKSGCSSEASPWTALMGLIAENLVLVNANDYGWLVRLLEDGMKLFGSSQELPSQQRSCSMQVARYLMTQLDEPSFSFLQKRVARVLKTLDGEDEAANSVLNRGSTFSGYARELLAERKTQSYRSPRLKSGGLSSPAEQDLKMLSHLISEARAFLEKTKPTDPKVLDVGMLYRFKTRPSIPKDALKLAKGLTATVLVRDCWGYLADEKRDWCLTQFRSALRERSDSWDSRERSQRFFQSTDRSVARELGPLLAYDLSVSQRGKVENSLALALTHAVDEVRFFAALGVGETATFPKEKKNRCTRCLELFDALDSRGDHALVGKLRSAVWEGPDEASWEVLKKRSYSHVTNLCLTLIHREYERRLDQAALTELLYPELKGETGEHKPQRTVDELILELSRLGKEMKQTGAGLEAVRTVVGQLTEAFRRNPGSFQGNEERHSLLLSSLHELGSLGDPSLFWLEDGLVTSYTPLIRQDLDPGKEHTGL